MACSRDGDLCRRRLPAWRKTFWWLALLAPLLVAQTARAYPATAPDLALLSEARQLLAQRQAEQAYQLLIVHEADWAGDRDYDYLLGAAAVDSGRPGEAILALQRALTVEPGYSAARMELGRAYYEIGDNESARREFECLRLENPPYYARRVIDNYLAAIQRNAMRYQSRFRAFVQFDAGYDSNANGATGDDSFLGFVLDDQNVADESGFAGFATGGTWSNPLNPRLTGYTQFSLAHRRHFSATYVNHDRATLGTSLVWRNGPWELNAGPGVFGILLDSRLPFDGETNQYGLLFDAGARRQFGRDWRLGGDLRAAALRYDSEVDVRDVDQVVYDLTAEHHIQAWNQMLIALTLLAGDDDARRSGSPYGRDQLGGRFSVSWLLDPTLRIHFYVGTLRSEYDGRFFGFEREDRQSTGSISLVWRAFRNPNWSLIPRITYTSNESDVELFDYNRTEAMLSLRWLAD